MKRCADCKDFIEPATWYRLVTGILLCGKCYAETQPKVSGVRVLR